MKKLLYLAVILCFMQVGISNAQTVVNDKKMEQVSSQKSLGSDVVTPTTMTTNESVTPTSTSKTSCTATKETPSCCQKKGTTASCCSGVNSTSSSKKNNPKSQKDASLNQNTGTTPK